MQQQQSESPFLSFSAGASLLIFLARIFSLPITVLLHKGYGSRFVGLTGVLAIIPFFFLVLVFSHSNPAPLMCLLLLYIARCAAGRATHLYRVIRKRVPKTHTRYAGRPLLARMLPNWSEDALLRIEPLGVFLLGLATVWLTRPLGWYLILAGIGSAAWHGITWVYLNNKLTDDQDAALEQEAFSERFREAQNR
jgi:hypothetical protein